ncbi:unnamed protein product [Polarella glacialis]|uniref:Apple domain-containing protein n=1 Tax=Polarella glacialis TaxID=89957 RepID=A0A813G655_POLGL|nr:unnamed protein product [Polarella glacialis]
MSVSKSLAFLTLAASGVAGLDTPACAVVGKAYNDTAVQVGANGGNVASAQICQSSCKADILCRHFTWYTAGWCWLQSEDLGDNVVTFDSVNATSGPKDCVGDDKTYDVNPFQAISDKTNATAVKADAYFGTGGFFQGVHSSVSSAASAVHAAAPDELKKAHYGFPIWGYMLIGFVVAGAGLCCAYKCGASGSRKKSKRGVKVDMPDAEAPGDAMVDMPAYTGKSWTTISPGVNPAYATVPQVTYAAEPMATYSAPQMSYAAVPQVTYTNSPQVVYQAPNVFNRLDTDGDGVLSQEEFARMGRA